MQIAMRNEERGIRNEEVGRSSSFPNSVWERRSWETSFRAGRGAEFRSGGKRRAKLFRLGGRGSCRTANLRETGCGPAMWALPARREPRPPNPAVALFAQLSARAGRETEFPGLRSQTEFGNEALFAILKWALAAWVLASLLFAHGCHGNEDHELFGPASRAIVK